MTDIQKPVIEKKAYIIYKHNTISCKPSTLILMGKLNINSGLNSVVFSI